MSNLLKLASTAITDNIERALKSKISKEKLEEVENTQAQEIEDSKQSNTSVEIKERPQSRDVFYYIKRIFAMITASIGTYVFFVILFISGELARGYVHDREPLIQVAFFAMGMMFAPIVFMVKAIEVLFREHDAIDLYP